VRELPPDEALHTVLDRALTGYEALIDLAHTIDDEWQYVTDLAAVWRGRLTAVAASRTRDAAERPVQVAAERAIEEIGLITDPHRAIDWLSTFPQLILLAIGEEDRPPPRPSAG
jgi:hypothetical protein